MTADDILNKRKQQQATATDNVGEYSRNMRVQGSETNVQPVQATQDLVNAGSATRGVKPGTMDNKPVNVSPEMTVMPQQRARVPLDQLHNNATATNNEATTVEPSVKELPNDPRLAAREKAVQYNQDANATANKKKELSMLDFINEMYKAPSPEELEAERKRQRNRAIMSAIGDGITSLANLGFTASSGVNAYDPAQSLSKVARERYDKILADRKADEDRLKALQLKGFEFDMNKDMQKQALEDANKRWETERTDKLDKEQRTEEMQKQKDKQLQENWDKTFAFNEKIKAKELELKKEYQDAMVNIKSVEQARKQANDALGKPVTIPGADNEQLVVYERVWNKNWPDIYKGLLDEICPEMDEGKREIWFNNMETKMNTPQKKQQFLLENVSKSKGALSAVRSLTGFTPEWLMLGAESVNNENAGQTMPGVSQNNNVMPGVQ